LPPTVAAIEGSDIAPVGIVDEIGFIPSEVYESALLSCGKRPGSGLLSIGTPAQPKYVHTTPLRGLLDAAAAGDPDVHAVEFGARHCDDFRCVTCLQEAYAGALGSVIALDDVRASMPPKTSEAEFRRTRRAEWVQSTAESFIPGDVWDSLARSEPIPAGADVIVGVDGSLSGDATALVLATVSEAPHLETLKLFERPQGAADWRIDVLAVEDAIREAVRRYRVREVVADPAYLERSLQVLAAERIPVARFPWSGARGKAASQDFRAAVVAGLVTHSGDPDLRRHVLNAVATDSGLPSKPSKHSKQHIDLLAASVMAVSRATWLSRKRGGRAISRRRRR